MAKNTAASVAFVDRHSLVKCSVAFVHFQQSYNLIRFALTYVLRAFQKILKTTAHRLAARTFTNLTSEYMKDHTLQLWRNDDEPIYMVALMNADRNHLKLTTQKTEQLIKLFKMTFLLICFLAWERQSVEVHGLQLLFH